MSVALQDMSPYARSIVERLGLETHPEGGWYTRDWQSPHADEASSRPLSSLIYFLLPEGDASAWHKSMRMRSGCGMARHRSNWSSAAATRLRNPTNPSEP